MPSQQHDATGMRFWKVDGSRKHYFHARSGDPVASSNLGRCRHNTHEDDSATRWWRGLPIGIARVAQFVVIGTGERTVTRGDETD